MGYIEDLKKLLLDQGEKPEDIETAVSYAKDLLHNGLPVIFDRKHLSLLLGVEDEKLLTILSQLENYYYQIIMIPKKSGGRRELEIPAVDLKHIQRWILDYILDKLHISPYAMGFSKGSSIVKNAKAHLGKHCVVGMDLKDFFPSISQEQVFRIFYYYGYTIEVSYALSRLCTYDGHLPQGSPASPALANLVCLKLDKRLHGLAEAYQADYTRYADDITFSSAGDLKGIVPVAGRIIEEEGFTVNLKKTHVAYDYQRQEVTGLLVNGDRVRVKREYLKRFRQEIYYCKKYGAVDHLKHIGCTKRFYRDHMYGKAYFLKMVDNELGDQLISELDSINWERGRSRYDKTS